MSTSGKLWLGFGLLIFLLVAIGLFVAHRFATIERALNTIMAVQEPATATTYDMALNVTGTSAAVLRHVSMGEPAPPHLIADQRTAFERLISRYDLVARSDVSRELGRQIHLKYANFAGLGDSLLEMSDDQRDLVAAFARDGSTLTGIVNNRLRPILDTRGRDGQHKLTEVAVLEASITGVGDALDLYVHAPLPARRARIAGFAEQFRVALRNFEAIHLTDEERVACQPLRASFEGYVSRAQRAADITDRLRRDLERFTEIGKQLQLLVEQGIHNLARTDLFEAQRSAGRAIHVGMIAVLILLVAGIFIGSMTALPVGRSVVSAERTLRERMEELAENDQRKDEFLAVLGHELRNPLAPLRNSLALLEADDRSVPERVRRLHAVMSRQVRDMTRLVDDLLDVSRVREGKITLRREPVELRGALEVAAQDLRPLAAARGIPLDLSLPGEPVWVHADPTRLAQMLANLVTNAVHYSSTGGRISLMLTRESRDAVVQVRDQGIGISAEMIPRVFEPFTQLDASPGRGHSGLGIGLTLVRRLAELHGGGVKAESAGIGKGSTFTLRLPRTEAPQLEPEVPAMMRATNGPPRRVLVVDDNRDSAESMAELIGLWGHEVDVAHDGDAALERAAAADPDVVLLDIGLPGIDGYEVARRVRAQPNEKHPLLIALTGLGQESDRQRALEAGFDFHLTKPVDPNLLRELMTRRSK